MTSLIKRMLLVVLLVACSPNKLSFSLNDLPPGDAGRGATLFTQSIYSAPACSSCHATDGSRSVGPSLKGFGAEAGERVKGQSAAEYAFDSILRPSKHVVRGYSNVMYSTYGEKLPQQDIADLIAYLLIQ
jgi:cytochrome c553